MATPQVHTHFTVNSSHLCYGELHNIWQGACAEPGHGLPTPQPQPSGTVQIHNLNHNVPAKTGTWNAYQLIDTTTAERLTGWTVAHESVNVLQELDKLLRVAGSPYEADSGSRFNDANTAAEGVLVINRYDWGQYDERALDVVEALGGGEHVENSDPSTYVPGISAALVDYAEAKAEVRFWAAKSGNERWEEQQQRPHGLWMHVPHGEYMFGRFGFDAERSAAQSFLLFSAQTDFTRTVVAGTQQPLRRQETPEERFRRHLREGFDFRGMEVLARLLPEGSGDGARPAEADLLGPYAQHERLFLDADVRAVLRQRANGLDFVEPWRERVEVLVNELLMSYLERYVALQGSSFEAVRAAAEALTPRREEHRSLDFHLFQCLTQPYANPVPDWDAPAVADRAQAFLISRGEVEEEEGGPGLFQDDEYIAGLSRALAFLLGEVLEIASNVARDSERSKIMPVDVRIAVCNDPELLSAFKFSRVYWNGSE